MYNTDYANTIKPVRATLRFLIYSVAGIYALYVHCGAPNAPFDNQLPVCSDLALQTSDAAPVTIDIPATDPDNDYIGWKIIQHPARGSVNKSSGTAGPGPEFTYTSNNLIENAVDTIVVAVSDWMDTLQYMRVNVIIAITAVDNPPVALGCTTIVYRNAGLLDLAGLDPEGKPVVWNIVTPPAHGSVIRVRDTVSDSLEAFYIPNEGSPVNDFFTFQVMQETNASNIDTVVLRMQNAYLLQQGVPINDADYDGCEDTYLKVTYKIPELVEMIEDTLTNFSESEELFLHFCT